MVPALKTEEETIVDYVTEEEIPNGPEEDIRQNQLTEILKLIVEDYGFAMTEFSDRRNAAGEQMQTVFLYPSNRLRGRPICAVIHHKGELRICHSKKVKRGIITESTSIKLEGLERAILVMDEGFTT